MADHDREQEIAMLLAQRAYLYSFFHVMFGAEPTSDSLGNACGAQTLDVLDALSPAYASDDMKRVRAFVAEFAQVEGEDLLESLKSDHSKLYLAPGDTSVPLWESPYLGQEGMVFQASTLDVRSRYHAAGFELQAEKRFPDDHIGAMMDFMGRMGQRAYDAYADGDDARCVQALADARDFAQAHLLTWIDDFADKTTEMDASGRYAMLARGMAAFVRADVDQLVQLEGELSSSL